MKEILDGTNPKKLVLYVGRGDKAKAMLGYRRDLGEDGEHLLF